MTLTELELSEAADELGWRGRILFTSKESRDEVARMAVSNGLKVKRSSMSNQLMDPRYTFEGRHLPDKGLGNDYRHYHAKLYEVEVVRT